MTITIEPMTINHYDDVIIFWKNSEHVGLSSADEKENIASYLSRNPRLSFVAKDKDLLVGAVLCGHDGRLGYIYHLAVLKSHRRKGIAKALVQKCITSLRNEGIQKSFLFIFHNNTDGMLFWEKIGWIPRSDIKLMSKEI